MMRERKRRYLRMSCLRKLREPVLEARRDHDGTCVIRYALRVWLGLAEVKRTSKIDDSISILCEHFVPFLKRH
jgi:hypothetical protein